MSSVLRLYECGECGEVYERWINADRCCPPPPEGPITEAQADDAAAFFYNDFVATLETLFGQRRLLP